MIFLRVPSFFLFYSGGLTLPILPHITCDYPYARRGGIPSIELFFSSVYILFRPNGLYNCYYLSSFCNADIFHAALCGRLHEIYGLLIFSGKVTCARGSLLRLVERVRERTALCR